MFGTLVRFLRRNQPREGWVLVLVLGVTLVTLAFSAQSAGWVPGLGGLLAGTVFFGFLVAFGAVRIASKWPAAQPESDALARSDRAFRRPGGPGLTAGLLLALAGVLVVSLLVGWGEAPASPPEVRWYLRPVTRAAAALPEMGYRLSRWVQDVAGGGAEQDDAVFGWFIALVAWGVVVWAVWWVLRHWRPLIGLLPAGILLALNGYFSWDARIWLPVYMAGLVLIQALVFRRGSELRWQKTGMDYSEDIRLEATVAALGIAGLIAALTATMPRVVVEPTARWFAELSAAPMATIEDTGKSFFPGLRRSPRSLLASGGGAGGMPRAFLLGSGPELSEELVMRVWTDDMGAAGPGQASPEPHYWRAVTYDLYDGRWWDHGNSQEIEAKAGEPWTEQSLAWRRPLKQQVELERGGDRALFAAGEPVAPNHPYRALVRSDAGLGGEDGTSDDLVALLGNTRRYSVLSLVPAVDEEVLRRAGDDYPKAVVDRYLQLPELSDRVLALAQETAAGSGSAYDQALALEQLLREYTYDLDVSPAPAGREVVDYFLFDARAGYCDYYATAMVVMARSLGIPARLAAGYATGDLDEYAGVYLVRGDQAHSWPELYFPGVGWVPFEPTAAREVFARSGLPGEREAGQAAGDEVTAELQVLRDDQIVRQRLRLVLMCLGALLLAVGAWGVSVLVRRRRPDRGLAELYQRLGQWGGRLGRPPGAGETAAEYGRELSQQVLGLDGDRASVTADGIVGFVTHFEAAQYGRERTQAALETKRIWRWLEAQLRRMWVTRGFWRRGGTLER